MMTQMDDHSDLTGKLLIAMPGMGDPRFERAVVLICAHSAEGAMGLIVNKPTPEVRLSELLEQLSIERSAPRSDVHVHYGGPVETGRGFVLHSVDYTSDLSTLQVEGGFAMTATLDILEAFGRGEGPSRALLALGYAGWGPGQLEDEISQNGWLTCAARADLVFAERSDAKWQAALAELGVDALTLSASAGHA